MKNTLKALLLFLVIFNSCSKDDEIINPEEETTNETVQTNPEIEPEPEITATETCLISDFDIQENSSITIDCLLDLEGATVNLPNGVTFDFDGGDVFNGTLNFGTSGRIDGALLNTDLTIEGNVSLISDNFQFVPERWNIVEVNDSNNPQLPTLEEAYNNHLIIQETLDFVKSIGATTFSIDQMDAFFDAVNGATDARSISNGVLTIPSDFNLRMTDNTFIRAFPPEGIHSSLLLKIIRSSNINISGGNLIGDRLLREHNFEGKKMGLRIIGGKNIVINNIHISNTIDSGLAIHSSSFLERDDFFQSQNVILRNSTFESNGKNNIQVTDGVDIIIENNTSYRAGIDVETPFGTSPGLPPRIGILVETQVMQFVEGVIIRNNIVEDSHSLEGHDILAAGASNIDITGNTAEKSVGWSTALNVNITNNTCGRVLGGFLGFEGTNNVISGNTITNPDGVGIFLTDQNVEVYNNNIINCKTGIQLSSLINADIHQNTITSNIEGTTGILGQNYLDNVNIYDNDFNLNDGKPLNIISINTEAEQQNYLFSFTENRITATENGLMPGSSNITIDRNQFTGAGINISNANNITVTNNIVTNSGDFATFAINNSINIEAIGNTFEGTNSGPFSTAVTISSPLESNIVFHNNMVKALGINFGMNVTNADDISIQENTIQNESTFRSPLRFTGNNSRIIRNTFINSNGVQGLSIEGNNNEISGND